MALYLGSEKIKINLDSIIYHLNLYSNTPIVNGVLLMSSDGYTLKDTNNKYITTPEKINGTSLLDSNNDTLKEANDLYVTIE